MIDSISSHLSQSERLVLCAGRFSPVVLAPESVDKAPPVHPVTGMPVFTPTWERKGTPSRALAGVRPTVYASPDEEMDEEQDEENELREVTAYKRRDSMREHSFRLPSQSSRGECLAEMRALGLAWSE